MIYQTKVHAVLNKVYEITVEADSEEEAIDIAGSEVYGLIEPIGDIEVYPEIVNE